MADATWIAVAASTATTAMTTAQTATRIAGAFTTGDERLAQRGILMDANHQAGATNLSTSGPLPAGT